MSDDDLVFRVQSLEADLERWKAAHQALAHRLDETEKWMTDFVKLVSTSLSH